MATGMVKWFNITKGYSLLHLTGATVTFYIHISAFERTGLTELAHNQKATFDIEASREGLESAANIALA